MSKDYRKFTRRFEKIDKQLNQIVDELSNISSDLGYMDIDFDDDTAVRMMISARLIERVMLHISTDLINSVGISADNTDYLIKVIGLFGKSVEYLVKDARDYAGKPGYKSDLIY